MRDGLTEKAPSSIRSSSGSPFFGLYRAVLKVLSGPRAGEEIDLTQHCVTIGRGPGVDLAFDDTQMSRQHVALDLEPEGYRVRDLGSTNGIAVNGHRTQSGTLSNGDRLEIGGCTFEYVLHKRPGSTEPSLAS